MCVRVRASTTRPELALLPRPGCASAFPECPFFLVTSTLSLTHIVTYGDLVGDVPTGTLESSRALSIIFAWWMPGPLLTAMRSKAPGTGTPLHLAWTEFMHPVCLPPRFLFLGLSFNASPVFISHHLPVFGELTVSSSHPSPCPWRFDGKLLGDASAVGKLRDLLLQSLGTVTDAPSHWDRLKRSW